MIKKSASTSFPKPNQLERSNQRHWEKAFEGLDIFDEATDDTLETEEDLPAVTIESSWNDEDNILDDKIEKFFKKTKRTLSEFMHPILLVKSNLDF